jgi:hypothetical protein
MFPVLSLTRNELLKEYKKKIIIKNIIFLKKILYDGRLDG